MGRRKGLPIHGWLILDKPQFMTSTHVLNKVKRIFNAAKAGHAGTLDPLATGVLPIAFGEATKTIPHAVDGAKHYRFKVQWGVETDTDDSEGKPVHSSDARPERTAIEAALEAFRGEIMQTPPRYSAIKIEGERAYDLAREGEDFEIAARPVTVKRLEIVECNAKDECVFEAECGKGTYVRALARDLGRVLGCHGHVTELRRTGVGSFLESSAVTLDTLEAASAKEENSREALMAHVMPVQSALDGIPALAIDTSDASMLRRGKSIILRGRDAPIHSGMIYATTRGKLVALGEVSKGELRPSRVFNIPL
ncbi:MAG: tRNA pseudouridine(55) synthase TruB [Hyphomicrobiales bacterium]|nr:tRNA pseudouridine(55) synthase TruB [Hyphomicrobiales bacterium]